jgi:hypothetical protein
MSDSTNAPPSSETEHHSAGEETDRACIATLIYAT